MASVVAVGGVAAFFAPLRDAGDTGRLGADFVLVLFFVVVMIATPFVLSRCVRARVIMKANVAPRCKAILSRFREFLEVQREQVRGPPPTP